MAVAGPSGSGKTLLLRAMALLDPLDAGEIRWRGQPVRRDRIPQFRASAVYLHQRPALPEETVEGALRRPFSLAVHRPKRFSPQRVTDWLRQLGRDEAFLAKNTGDLSGGERQIVALLRALQLDPAVLLLDEPTAALDPPTATAAEELLRDWVAAGSRQRALLWVTHDAAQAGRAARQTLWIQEGRAVGSG